jgi:hypothetical protein
MFAIRLGAAVAMFSALGSLARTAEPPVAKRVLRTDQAGPNLLRADAWRPYEKGFLRDGETFVCDNAGDAKVHRGLSQTIELNQERPEPIVAAAWSKAEGVGGSPDSDYSVYLDLTFADGTPLWGQVAKFSTGTHDWQRRQVMVLPEKPVKRLSFHLLLRGHGGKAWFRDPELRVVKTPAGACLFDGVPVVPVGKPREGFQIRDVAHGSDYRFLREHPQLTIGDAFDIQVEWREAPKGSFCVRVQEIAGEDRAITFTYVVPVEGKQLRWLGGPRESVAVESGREYMQASPFRAGSGRLSRWPLGAVAGPETGTALAIDPRHPAFCRIGFNAATNELFVAYDIALSEAGSVAPIFRFWRFNFDPKSGFRGALARYYELYPDAFRVRTPQQGLWMPFAKISQVQGWQDFGFKFKEGNDETKWDDEHGILTFRYTEPMTWWMSMSKDTPRTLDAALAEAKRLADKGSREAKALLASGHHDADGRFAARLLDTPWCNGAVWSMNSMPGIEGEVTDFKNKWNPELRGKLYGPKRNGDLDGEYVDSSEGYVTDELDFRRDHFAAAQTPLVFSPDDYKPAIFRGLIAYEYVRGIEKDIHAAGKLMMANGAPDRLWWLAPMLDVMGTETDWNPGGKWRPTSDAELLYRRALCKGKPYCFLMNTHFEKFSSELVEKYMKRCLAYGMFPGFFSHNASQGAYFTRPELFDRDRLLFKKYVPLCKRVAEAGWEPLTRATSSDPHVYVERFGEKHLTVFNDSREQRTVTITWEGEPRGPGRELLSGRAVQWRDGKATLELSGEDVAVIE